jgi:prepilin-type N-terminal cleavage/methylation domain-containing protein
MVYASSQGQLLSQKRVRGERRSNAFTLVELLVVIAIIGVLVALLLPAVQAAREAARRSTCLNNLKQCQLGMINFQDANKKFPAGRSGSENQPGLSAFVQILPFIEQQTLYDMMDLKDQPWDDTHKPAYPWASIPNNLKFNGTVVPTYRCPSDPVPATYKASEIDWTPGDSSLIALSSYGYNWGRAGSTSLTNKEKNDGVFVYRNQFAPKKIADGLSKTMFVGEAQSRVDLPSNPIFQTTIPWSMGNRRLTLRTTQNPINAPTSIWFTTPYGIEDGGFGSHHTGGAHFSFGDGHVVFMDENIDFATYQALSTRSNNEIVREP